MRLLALLLLLFFIFTYQTLEPTSGHDAFGQSEISILVLQVDSISSRMKLKILILKYFGPAIFIHSVSLHTSFQILYLRWGPKLTFSLSFAPIFLLRLIISLLTFNSSSHSLSKCKIRYNINTIIDTAIIITLMNCGEPIVHHSFFSNFK